MVDKPLTGPEGISISITDSLLDRDLCFTDADHYIQVATQSGVPVPLSGTPVHRHAEASTVAEQQKAEMRQTAIDRHHAERNPDKKGEKDGKAGEDAAPATPTKKNGEDDDAHKESGDVENTPPADLRRMTVTNLDTGEEFVIGENDPDFEWDTFELNPCDSADDNTVATKSGSKGSGYDDKSAKAMESAMDATLEKNPGGTPQGSQQSNKESASGTERKKRTLWRRIKDFFMGKRKTSSAGDKDGAAGGGDSSEGNSGNKGGSERRRTPFTQLSSFKFRKELGRGAFGRVLLAEAKADGSLYALKIISKKNMRQSDRRQAKTERDILHAMSQTDPHPFTTGLKFAFQSENNLYLGMNYIPGGTLRELIKREGCLPIDWVVQYTAELVLAISHMHSLRMLYRDIKPHNVMLDHEGHITIIDFGLSKQEISSPRGAMSLVGTPDYSAPEVLKTGVHQIEANRAVKKDKGRGGRGNKKGGGKDSDGAKKGKEGEETDSTGAPVGYGKAADWWSLGVMVYEMIGGTPAFRGADLRQTYQKVLFATLEFLPEDRFDESDEQVRRGRSLITGLLVRDPTLRLGFDANPPKDIMKHPFFESLDWDAVYARKEVGPWVPENVYGSKREKRLTRKDSKSAKNNGKNSATGGDSLAPQTLPAPIGETGRLVSVDTATPFVMEEGAAAEGDDNDIESSSPGRLSKIEESIGSKGSNNSNSAKSSSYRSANASQASANAKQQQVAANETSRSKSKKVDVPVPEVEVESAVVSESDGDSSSAERTSSVSSEEMLSMRDSVLSPSATQQNHNNRLPDWSFIDDKMLLAAVQEERKVSSKSKKKKEQQQQQQQGKVMEEDEDDDGGIEGVDLEEEQPEPTPKAKSKKEAKKNEREEPKKEAKREEVSKVEDAPEKEPSKAEETTKEEPNTAVDETVKTEAEAPNEAKAEAPKSEVEAPKSEVEAPKSDAGAPKVEAPTKIADAPKKNRKKGKGKRK
jgi:serine/threonine protein kinase